MSGPAAWKRMDPHSLLAAPVVAALTCKKLKNTSFGQRLLRRVLASAAWYHHTFVEHKLHRTAPGSKRHGERVLAQPRPFCAGS